MACQIVKLCRINSMVIYLQSPRLYIHMINLYTHTCVSIYVYPRRACMLTIYLCNI